jgi:hypothetical protein
MIIEIRATDRVMQTLWLAIFLYSVGLGLALHFRPALMFNANGSWKEFGYKRDTRYTMFPVWLFAIVWAVASYAIAAVVSGPEGADAELLGASAAAATYMNSSPFNTSAEEDYEMPDGEMEAISSAELPPPSNRRGRGRPRKQPRPGYYVLDSASEREGGLRRYIYYGNAPPVGQDVEEVAETNYTF